MEQAASRSRLCTVDQLIQEQAGKTLERYGRFQLNRSAANQHQVSSIIEVTTIGSHAGSLKAVSSPIYAYLINKLQSVQRRLRGFRQISSRMYLIKLLKHQGMTVTY